MAKRPDQPSMNKRAPAPAPVPAPERIRVECVCQHCGHKTDNRFDMVQHLRKHQEPEAEANA